MDYIALITNVGFPIAAVIGLALFVKSAYHDFYNRSKDREEKLYTMIGEQSTQMRELGETNARFVEVLDNFSNNINDIKTDVEDIKNVLNINRRKDD